MIFRYKRKGSGLSIYEHALKSHVFMASDRFAITSSVDVHWFWAPKVDFCNDVFFHFLVDSFFFQICVWWAKMAPVWGGSTPGSLPLWSEEQPRNPSTHNTHTQTQTQTQTQNRHRHTVRAQLFAIFSNTCNDCTMYHNYLVARAAELCYAHAARAAARELALWIFKLPKRRNRWIEHASHKGKLMGAATRPSFSNNFYSDSN